MTNARRVHYFRFARIVVCIAVIVTVFYLYIPPVISCIHSMNTTVEGDSVDILCVGSSHMGYGINPIQMFEDRGYAAYSIWCGSQAPWQSYYYIKQACKYQNPDIIIYDVYTVGSRDESEYKDYQTVENMLDTPLSVDKIEAVMESAADSKLSILLRFPYIYDEYDPEIGLSSVKFYGVYSPSMGYMYKDSVIDKVEDADYVNLRKVTEIKQISPKNEKYLRKIIGYCQENGIDIVLVNAPCPMIDEEGQARFNYISDIASKCNVPYIDGNLVLDEIGIDWSTDLQGTDGHINHSGITKFTIYVENFVEENYSIPDRRGDDRYRVYEDGIKWLENEIQES